MLPPSDNAIVPAHPALPVAPERRVPARGRSRWKALALLAVVTIGAGGGVAYWQHLRQGGLPSGIVSGNGRIEADEIDIDTKFAGRIAEMFADEGDMVNAQQVLARMDTRTSKPRLRNPRLKSRGRSKASARRMPMSCSRRAR